MGLLCAVACGGFDRGVSGYANDCDGACVGGARSGDGGDGGGGSDARCSASCVVLRAMCGADPRLNLRRAHETWNTDHVCYTSCADMVVAEERVSGQLRGKVVEDARCQPDSDGATAPLGSGCARCCDFAKDGGDESLDDLPCPPMQHFPHVYSLAQPWLAQCSIATRSFCLSVRLEVARVWLWL